MTEKGTCDDCAFRHIPRDQPNGRKCDDCGAFADYKNWELLEGRTKGYPNNVDDLLDWAWLILANVSGGRWSEQSEDWQEVVIKWREKYHQYRKPFIGPKERK